MTENWSAIIDLVANAAVIVALASFAIQFWRTRRQAKKSKASVIRKFKLEEAIRDIKLQLRKLESKPAEWLGLELKDIELKLAVERETTTSGELSIPVLDEGSLGTTEKATDKVGSTITVVLTPPKPHQSKTLRAEDQLPRKLDFADVLNAVFKALHASMEVEPKLDAKSITVALEFVLTSTRNDNTKISAKVVSVGANIDRTSVASNTFTVAYKNPQHKD